MKSDDTRIDTRSTRWPTAAAGLAAAGLAAALLLPALLGAQIDCTRPGINSPAVPVPECVDSDGFEAQGCPAGSIRLWPSNDFHPAPFIPATRDSTDREAGGTIPGANSGHELFRSVDVVTVGGTSRRLYAAYNAGLQVWDLEANPEDPARLDIRDGWRNGEFLLFPPVSEILNYIEDIAAVNVDATTDVAAVAGLQPAGVSLWEFATGLGQLRQLYQDSQTSATQIRLVERNDGKIYAFAGAENGLTVYDVTAARSLPSPCLEQQGSACGTVFKGFVGDTFNRTRIFIDVLHVPGPPERIFVSASGGFSTDFELWQVDPDNPSLAMRLFTGHPDSLGSALFQHNGHSYLAIVTEEDGIDNEKLEIFLIDGCVSGATCTLVEAVSPITVAPGWNTFKDFLTFSEAAGTPYLYYGAQTSAVSGPDLEQLFDLSSLRPPSPDPLPGLPEVTESGASYTDPCNGSEIRYWSHSYQNNYHGLNEVFPQVGKFSAQGYFYRAANAVLDVHFFGAGTPPPGETTVQVDATDPAVAPHWMGQPITFNATATPDEDCAGGTWGWLHTDTEPTAQPPDTDDVATIAFELCGAADCPARNPFVSASNTACPDAVSVAEQGVTVQDPRPQIRPPITIAPAEATNTYDIGTPLTFNADVDGRNDATVPMSFTWEFFELGQASSTFFQTSQPTLILDTCDPAFADPTFIFADGFESGNVVRWTIPLPGEESTTPVWLAKRSLSRKGTAPGYRVELTATSSEGSAFDDQTVFNLNGAGPLAFGPNGLQPDQGSQDDAGGVTFTVDSNAAEVRWEFEDAAGTATACLHYPPSCTVFEWAPAADNGQISHVWEEPNPLGGSRGVTVEIRKCEETLSTQNSVTLNVVPTSVIPTVLLLEIDPDDIAPLNMPVATKPCVWSSFPFDLKCRPNRGVRFLVTTDADPVSDYQFDLYGTSSFGAFTSSLTQVFPTTATNAFQPAVKARKGSGVSAAFGNLTYFGSPISMTVQNF